MNGMSLGKWLGIDVELHWTWLGFMAYIAVIRPEFFWAFLGLFALVLLHEFGHCLAAIWRKAPVSHVTLYPIGGVARMQIPEEPKDEMIVVMAGPLVNLLLWYPLYMLKHLHPFIEGLAFTNMMLVFFNLIPAYPLDGGRIFRASLAMFIDYVTATTIAVRVGQLIGVLFIILGVYCASWVLVVSAIYLLVMSEFELRCIKLRREYPEG